MYLKKNGLPSRPPYIYFIASGGFVKIGYTDGSVSRRLLGIQSANPNQVWLMATIEGGPAEEASLHLKHLDHWVRGEWFKLHPALYREITAVAESPQAVVVPIAEGTRTKATAKAKAERASQLSRNLERSPEKVPKQALTA